MLDFAEPGDFFIRLFCSFSITFINKAAISKGILLCKETV